MTLNDFERRDAMGHFFQADLHNNAHTVVLFDLERPNSAGGREAYF